MSAWTEEAIVAEFEKHLAYWQEKLRLRDLDVLVRVAELPGIAWCAIEPANCGANHAAAVLTIQRDGFAWATPYDVWETAAHELVHALNWCMAHAFDSLTDHFSVSQMNMAKSLMKDGNEKLAYKWEAILTKWFAADAPPRDRAAS